MRKRRLKTLLFILLTPVVLLCVFLLFERVRGQISLARFKRELIAKGEKLTFAELIPPFPEGENGAPEIREAIKRLQKGAVLPNNLPPVMKLTPSGRAVLGFREDVWVTDFGPRDGEWISDKTTNTWEQLSADLKTNKVTLAEIRVALAKPVLNNNLDYGQGCKMKLPHLAPTKSATFWFGAASQLALREGNHHDALTNLIAEFRLARLPAEDRLVISELVRIAITAIARTATWEALQADDWTDEQLGQLQQAWWDADFATAMMRSFEGERAFGESSFEQLRRSNEDASQALYWQDIFEKLFPPDRDAKSFWWHETLRGTGEFFRKQVYCRIWRFAWSHQDERRNLRGMQNLIEISRIAASEKSYEKAIARLDEFYKETLNHNFYDELRFRMSEQSLRSLAVAIKRAMRTETERSITVCAIALKRYSLRHEKPPTSLDALLPEFLSSVPVDYMDGKPLRYRLNADGSFTLYSVGEDGKDDGGDTALLPDKTSTRNLWDRKDFVWPSPATPEEVEAYRKEAASE